MATLPHAQSTSTVSLNAEEQQINAVSPFWTMNLTLALIVWSSTVQRELIFAPCIRNLGLLSSTLGELNF